MLQIDYEQTSFLPVEQKEQMLEQLERVIQYAYEHYAELAAKDWEMSITFMNNAEIQALNKQYRHLDKPTDVLSFAFEDEMSDVRYPAGEKVSHILGEIFISVERAYEQADAYGHNFARELTFLALHGFLHLLGYDHNTPTEEAEMFGLQKTILSELNIER